MKSIRISLLNIVVALLVFWLGMQLIEKNIALSTAIWMGVLICVLLIIDQLFRMMVKSLKRIWMVETIFLLLSFLAIWIVRYVF